MPQQPSLTLRRRLKSPVALVYAAWTEPEHMAHWFAPADCEVLSASAEPRVGGRFRVVMGSKEGERYIATGEYREVVADEKLVFTWMWEGAAEWESLVTVELRGEGDHTLLTLTHERHFDETARDDHGTGWSGALDKLEAYVSS